MTNETNYNRIFLQGLRVFEWCICVFLEVCLGINFSNQTDFTVLLKFTLNQTLTFTTSDLMWELIVARAHVQTGKCLTLCLNDRKKIVRLFSVKQAFDKRPLCEMELKLNSHPSVTCFAFIPSSHRGLLGRVGSREGDVASVPGHPGRLPQRAQLFSPLPPVQPPHSGQQR